MAAEKPAKGEPALMKDLFFDPPEATGGKWKCKFCEGALTWRGSNSGYSAFVQHMKGSHSSTWRRDLDELKSNNARNGNLDGYVRRTVSDKAINLFNWIDCSGLRESTFQCRGKPEDAEVFKPAANHNGHADEVHGTSEPKSAAKTERFCS